MPLWVRLFMWSDRKPWWQRKAGENEGKHAKDLPYANNWCVVKVGRFEHRIQNFHPIFVVTYKPCLRINAPQIFTPQGKIEKQIEVDYLTKHEAYAVAKGLNFLDGE